MCDLKNGIIEQNSEFFGNLLLSKEFYCNEFNHKYEKERTNIIINKVTKPRKNIIIFKLSHKKHKNQIGNYTLLSST